MAADLLESHAMNQDSVTPNSGDRYSEDSGKAKIERVIPLQSNRNSQIVIVERSVKDVGRQTERKLRRALRKERKLRIKMQRALRKCERQKRRVIAERDAALFQINDEDEQMVMDDPSD
jgi:hypothetical protein